MSPQYSDRFQALVKQALDLPPEYRAAFIERIRLEDDNLGRELAARVEATQETDSMHSPAPDPRDLTPRLGRFFADGELVLDRFRIVRFLGRGGMGEVYEARDLQLGQVALKTIRSKAFIGGEDLARFRREVQMARKVTDTHVCRIYDLFTIPASAARVCSKPDCTTPPTALKTDAAAVYIQPEQNGSSRFYVRAAPAPPSSTGAPPFGIRFFDADTVTSSSYCGSFGSGDVDDPDYCERIDFIRITEGSGTQPAIYTCPDGACRIEIGVPE